MVEPLQPLEQPTQHLMTHEAGLPKMMMQTMMKLSTLQQRCLVRLRQHWWWWWCWWWWLRLQQLPTQKTRRKQLLLQQ